MKRYALRWIDGDEAAIPEAAKRGLIRHYEKGGLERPSRSATMMPVQLSDQERGDLVAFLGTLTGNPEGEAAPKLPGE